MHRYDTEGIKSLFCVRVVSSKSLFVCVCLCVGECTKQWQYKAATRTYSVYPSNESYHWPTLASISSLSFPDIKSLN